MRLKYSKGSITVEAAIVVPIFICIIMSIVLLIRVVYIQGVMQHAINETAREISTYSYIYSISGIQKAHDNTQEKLDDNTGLEEYFAQAVEAYNAVYKSTSQSPESNENYTIVDISLIKERLDSLENSLDNSREEVLQVTKLIEDIFKDPKKAFISMAYLIGDGSFNAFKTKYVSEPVATVFVKKFLNQDGVDANTRLISMSVVDGFDGLDFSQSKLFEDNKTVDIVVRYRIKNILPIKIIPDINLIQRSTVKAWLDGEDENAADKQNSGTNVWDLAPLKRGVRIQQELGRNLPDRFPVISKFEQGTAVMIKSIDLEETTYHKPANLRSKVNGFISELMEFKSGSYMDTTVKAEDIKNKKLIIVVPEGTISPDIQKTFDECIRRAGGDIVIEIKEYGRKSSKKSEGE
jgi:hypothetical protein